ncbi:MAG: InlB B-repeat-containing protein [Clostridia bacterium]|nr:InlB B-repeat-containing protein [Clostridia bacterium]
MSRTKRIFALLIAFLMLASVCPAASGLQTEEGAVTFNPILTAEIDSERDAPFALNSETSGFDFSTIRAYLLENLENFATSISIRSYNIPMDQIQALADYIFNEIPEAFHVKYSFSYRTQSGYLSSLTNLTYRYTQTEYAQMRAEFDQNAALLLRDLSDTGMTELEKALLLHDRIITWTEYGYCGDSSAESPCYTAAGPLLLHEGVCDGYTRLYGYLLSKVGITNQYVDSVELNHAWNLVQIGGEWYHVDVTWDDGGWTDIIGRAFHNNFLRSTAGIIETGHNTNDFNTMPVSTTYDHAYWQDSLTEFVWCDHSMFYIDSLNGALYRRNGSSTQNVLTLHDFWGGWAFTQQASSGHNESFQHLYCLSEDNGYLYYSSPTKVIQLSVPSLTAVPVYTPTLASGSYIYGMKAVDWTLTVQSGTNPIEITQTEMVPIAHDSIVAYDANGGSGAPSSQTKPYGQSLTLSYVTPTREQYVFDEWNTKADGTGVSYQPGDIYTTDENVTLYAQWSKEPPVIQPTTGGVLINKYNHFIYGLQIGSSAESCLAVSNGTIAVTYSNPKGIVGTGTTVTVYDTDQAPVDSYTIVVFGDINGDGWYDGTDAYFLSLIASGMIPLKALTDAERMACDANHDDVIDVKDAKLVQQAGLLLSSIDQSANNEDLVTNSIFLEYCGLIDQSAEGIEADQPQSPITEQTNNNTPIIRFFRALFHFLINLFKIV